MRGTQLRKNGIRDHGDGMLHRMNALILAVESTSPPGDDLQVLALALAGIAMVVAGVAAAIVTPRAEHHDH
jgi:hypothetical protein